jgi:hypothetical protein
MRRRSLAGIKEVVRVVIRKLTRNAGVSWRRCSGSRGPVHAHTLRIGIGPATNIGLTSIQA